MCAKGRSHINNNVDLKIDSKWYMINCWEYIMRLKKIIHFCTGSDSPEVVLAGIVPIITFYVLVTNNPSYSNITIVSVAAGLTIYLVVTLLKNAIAFILKSDSACGIPSLNTRHD